MDGRDFAIRLKKIKAEVLALKQAHKYGLNRSSFYTSSSSFIPVGSPSTVYARITIRFDMESDEVPFFLLYSDFTGLLNETTSWSWDSTTKTVIVDGTVSFYVVSISATIVSTKPLLYFRIDTR